MMRSLSVAKKLILIVTIILWPTTSWAHTGEFDNLFYLATFFGTAIIATFIAAALGVAGWALATTFLSGGIAGFLGGLLVLWYLKYSACSNIARDECLEKGLDATSPSYDQCVDKRLIHCGAAADPVTVKGALISETIGLQFENSIFYFENT
jgi:hypothetical protein